MDFTSVSCKLATARTGFGARNRALLVSCMLALAGCASHDGGGLAYTSDQDGVRQIYPANYRTELLAFLRTYLNDPSGVRAAMIAEPVRLTVGGRQRYVVCVRYSARKSDGRYGQVRERAVLYIDGRLDRLIEEGDEICAGATYAAFSELEKLSR